MTQGLAAVSLAWHFVGEKLRDGSAIPSDGEWLTHTGPLIMCQSGLHASLHPFDALTYAPGSTLCYVELAGGIIWGNDKVVAMQRKILARTDATILLQRFAKACALDVIHLWKAPQVVIDFLHGEESLKDAARNAAWGAAWGAAQNAAWAARSAAWAARDAARNAAWGARNAAWGARDAARNAARDAVCATQRKRFLSSVLTEFPMASGTQS